MMENKWLVRKLGDICEVLNGFAFKSDKYVDEGVRIIRITNVQHGYIEDNDPKFYPIDECERLNQYMLKEQDLLMSLTGNVGRVGLMDNKFLPAALNQRVACLRVKNENVELKYLFHHLNSELFETRCIQSAKGIAQKNMNTEWLKEYPIPIPPLPEQFRIVEELDQLSNIIEKKRQQLSELDNLAQSIFYDMFGDPVTNEKGWEVKKLGEVCKTSSGGTPSKSHSEYYEGGYIPWLRSGEVNKMYIFNTELFITEEGLVNSSAKWFPENTVVIAMYGATVGQVGILRNMMTTNQAICGIFPNESFTPIYLYHFLLSKKEEYIKLASGGAQPNISQNIIKDTLVCCPPLSLQQLFAQKIEVIEVEKEIIKQSISETENLYDCKMAFYFN